MSMVFWQALCRLATARVVGWDIEIQREGKGSGESSVKSIDPENWV